MPAAPASYLVATLGRAIFRHAGKMMLGFVLGMTLVVVVTFLSPKGYRSEAKLYVRLGRENATLDPTATLGQNPVIAVPPTRENELNSFLEILTSRNLLEQVIDKVGLETVTGKVQPEGETKGTTKALALQVMARKLHIEVVKRSNILVVSYQADSPEKAQTVVSTLVDLYLEQHVRLHRTPGAYRFLVEQMTRVQKQVAKSEDDLRRLRERTGLVSVEGQRQQLLTRIGRLEDDLLQTEAALGTAEAESSLLRKRVEKLPATQVTGTTRGLPNQALDTMRSQLYTLQLKEQELGNRYPENHPEVKTVRRQLQSARTMLEKEEKEREQVTTGPGKLNEDAQVALLRQETQLRGQRARLEKLQTQITEQRKALSILNAEEPSLARVQRDLDLQMAQQRKYAESLEQLQIDQALQTERISNINLFQPATFDPIPVKPRWTINLGLGLAFSLGASLALAFLLESVGSTIRNPAQAGETLGVSLLATIPRIRRTPGPLPETVLAPCRRAWSRLAWPDDGLGTRVVAVGQSATSSSSAVVALARAGLEAEGEPVLLIEMGPGTVSPLLGVCPVGPGFGDVLPEETAIADAVHATSTPGLHVLPAPNAGLRPWTRDPGRTAAVFDRLRQSFTSIVIVLPAETSMTDRRVLGSVIDGLILIATEERTTMGWVRSRLEEWTALGVRPLGLLVEEHRPLPRWFQAMAQSET